MSVSSRDDAGVLTEFSLVVAAVFWGSNYAATKFAAISLPALTIVAFRFVVGGLLMYGVLRILEPESKLRCRDLLPMAGLGCLGVAVVFHEGLGAGDATSPVGDLCVLLAAIGFGAYTVLSMHMLKRYSPLAVATYPTLFGAPIVLAFSLPLFSGVAWENVGVGPWAAVAFSAVFATAFAFSAWQTGVSRIGANRVLVYQYLITLTGIGSGVVFFGEVLDASKIAGGAVILFGVYLARRR